ncbi:hypothetical protein Ciccas_001917 [Cichlidogyrus casuarinus]|uniref:Uncharacterized protein n=1 Tax=Cichlidogyrus casuarinus TaxID=1844966 RepID=A0ABD2QJP5_9PLAT
MKPIVEECPSEDYMKYLGRRLTVKNLRRNHSYDNFDHRKLPGSPVEIKSKSHPLDLDLKKNLESSLESYSCSDCMDTFDVNPEAIVQAKTFLQDAIHVRIFSRNFIVIPV